MHKLQRRFKSLNDLEIQEQAIQRQEIRRWSEQQLGKLSVERDAIDLTAHVLRQLGRNDTAQRNERYVIVGVPERTTVIGNFDHVPMAVSQLIGMKLQARALAVCAPLDPILLRYTNAAFQRMYRQCIVITLY